MTKRAADIDEMTSPVVQPPKRSGLLHRFIPVFFVVLGIVVLIYPVVATQYNNVKQRSFANDYPAQVSSTQQSTLSAALQEARDYNGTLSGVPILDPYLVHVAGESTSEAYNHYLSMLDDFDAMARVRVPTASVNLPVRHGTSEKSISEGAGHLYGTSLPVGGVGTHAVLTSHTGMSNATLFDHLTSVQEGDLMFVDVYGETLAYEVDSITVVLPNEVESLRPLEGEDLLTLFTCTPYAVNSHRLLVTGHRVPFTAELAEQAAAEMPPSLVLEPWMWGLLGGAAAAIALFVVLLIRDARRNRRLRTRSGAVVVDPRVARRALDSDTSDE